MKFTTYSKQASIAKSNRVVCSNQEVDDNKSESNKHFQRHSSSNMLPSKSTTGCATGYTYKSQINSFVTEKASKVIAKQSNLKSKYDKFYQRTLNRNGANHRIGSNRKVKVSKPNADSKNTILSKTKSLLSQDFDSKFAFTTYHHNTKSVFPFEGRVSPGRQKFGASHEKKSKHSARLKKSSSNFKPTNKAMRGCQPNSAKVLSSAQTLSNLGKPSFMHKKSYVGAVRNINLDSSSNSSNDNVSFKAAKDSLNNLIGETKSSFTRGSLGDIMCTQTIAVKQNNNLTSAEKQKLIARHSLNTKFLAK